jgi:hypothetical protein
MISHTDRGEDASRGKCVDGDSIMKPMSPELRGESERRGNRVNSESPRPLAKGLQWKRQERTLSQPTSNRWEETSINRREETSLQHRCKLRKIADQIFTSLDQSRPLRDVQASAAVSDMQTLRPCLVDSLRQGG